jgi:RNA polymerase sigma-70 factor (ECF subfamily)
MPETTETADERAAALEAALEGDEAAFSGLVQRYRRELQAHCYRMMGSLEDAEDLAQETFLRAWSRRATYEGRASFRAWLYRIATNVCLDSLKRQTREGRREPLRDGEGRTFEVPWLQPYPDRLLDEVPSRAQGPAERVASREAVELTFLVAIQQLSHRERAALTLRTVAGFTAEETAGQLDTSVAAVNSAVQRARAALRRELGEPRDEWARAEPSPAERELLERYIECTDNADADRLRDLLSADARFAMPPEAGLHVGADAIVDSIVRGGFGSPEYSDFRCALTWANRQPAVACYLRKPGWGEYRPLAIDVLRIDSGRIAEILAFPLTTRLIEAFDLPLEL